MHHYETVTEKHVFLHVVASSHVDNVGFIWPGGEILVSERLPTQYTGGKWNYAFGHHNAAIKYKTQRSDFAQLVSLLL